jgi:large subunit ribosomal protein L24
MSFRIKKNDKVIVLSGQDKGKTGKVLQVNTDKDFVKVENVRMMSKHKKARSAQETGGIMKIEGNIHISNVMIVCPECGKPTRIATKIEGEKRFRVCKKCGGSLEVKVEKVKKGKKDKAEKAEVESTKSSDSRVKRTRKPKAEKAAETAEIAETAVEVNDTPDNA